MKAEGHQDAELLLHLRIQLYLSTIAEHDDLRYHEPVAVLGLVSVLRAPKPLRLLIDDRHRFLDLLRLCRTRHCE